MQFKHRKCAAIVAEKVFYFSFPGIAVGIGMMIGPGPGPDDYLLRWDSSKIVPAAVTASMLGVVIGVLEARHWLKRCRESVRASEAEGKDPSALYPAQPQARSPF
ncbi:hypothetical protein [Methylobacterium sp. Leaf123]|uniref:hypothetical protein n=1 Tax=Methylobacterium sp. Leaf123 TaxID=1736264 RepID=UPI0012E92F93|nr:hypothetical protein [Methylobacterium sp. Leaf123]